MFKLNSQLIDWIAFATKIYSYVLEIIADKKLNYKDYDSVQALVNESVVTMAHELNWTVKLTDIRVREATVIVDEIFYHLPHPEETY